MYTNVVEALSSPRVKGLLQVDDVDRSNRQPHFCDWVGSLGCLVRCGNDRRVVRGILTIGLEILWFVPELQRWQVSRRILDSVVQKARLIAKQLHARAHAPNLPVSHSVLGVRHRLGHVI